MKKSKKQFTFISIIIFIVFAVIGFYLINEKIISDINDKNPVETDASQKSFTVFPEDAENQKYITEDIYNIFSKEFIDTLKEFEFQEVIKYLKSLNEEKENVQSELMTEEEADVSQNEYSFDFLSQMEEKEQKKLIEDYTEQILNTIIHEGYDEELLYENIGAEKTEEKDLAIFMLNKVFEKEDIINSLNEEYGEWYQEHTNRTDFQNIIQELQFISVAEKNYICLRGELLECPDDVTDITKCDMSVTMIGKQGNSYFYMVTDQFYQHQYLITFASTEEYSITLFL